MTVSNGTISKDAIVIERTFKATVDFVWQLWTQPELFKKWYGPAGFTVPVAEMDVRVGGKRLICMETPDGSRKIWTTGEYTEVVLNKRLVYTESMADEYGNVVLPSAHGMNDEQYPATTTITVQLEDLGRHAKMVMTHTGLPANRQGANEGWEQAFAKLTDYIEAVLSGK
jgi:uncharacterized protein YndB with AHSA1/START domain